MTIVKKRSFELRTNLRFQFTKSSLSILHDFKINVLWKHYIVLYTVRNVQPPLLKKMIMSYENTTKYIIKNFKSRLSNTSVLRFLHFSLVWDKDVRITYRHKSVIRPPVCISVKFKHFIAWLRINGPISTELADC